MSEQTQADTQERGGSVAAGFERLWGEIKQISKQVERETRRSGRVARLHVDTRKIRREMVAVQKRLGQAVYEARAAGGDDLRLSEVEGYAGGVAALDSLNEQLHAKEADIEQARHTEAVPAAESVVEEPVSG